MIDSFLTSALVNASPHLRVRPEALTRDFILYGAYIPMLNSTTGHSLKGRVVRFKLAADRLIMLESPQGYTLSNGHDSFILLAEFPIVRQDDDGVIIDFAKGMSNIFTMRNVRSVSVADKARPQTADQFRSVSFSASFVRFIEADGEVLTVSQVAHGKIENRNWYQPSSALIFVNIYHRHLTHSVLSVKIAQYNIFQRPRSSSRPPQSLMHLSLSGISRSR